MPKTCLSCKAAASKDVPILCCGACRSAVYCSKVCQKEHWKEHKKICKSLNVGEGAMQVRSVKHTENLDILAEGFKQFERNLGKDGKRFFKYFTQSTLEGSQAAARKMKKIVIRETRHSRKVLLCHSIYLLIHTDSKKLLWPNCPFIVLLQFVDLNALDLVVGDETRFTLLHYLARMADPTNIDYSTHENQLTLGRQLIEHGANVNALEFPNGHAPLHLACLSGTTTNLDFIQLLLENGADPNAQDLDLGRTPLMYTTKMAPGAAKFLLEWPTTDVNIIDLSGASFLAHVRGGAIQHFADKVAIPDNPDRVEDQFVLQQWREIEETLVERARHDTGTTAVE
jgi:hypothetical protein